MALMMTVDGWHYEDMEGYGASELNLFFILFLFVHVLVPEGLLFCGFPVRGFMALRVKSTGIVFSFCFCMYKLDNINL